MAKSFVRIDESFADDLEKLALHLENWSDETQKALVKAHNKIGQRHKTEAQKRVPVDQGTLKQQILTNTYQRPGEIVTETGSNLKYAVYVEFGTKYIAKGAVQRIGTKPIVTDAEAIKVWPAKNKDRIDKAGKPVDGAVIEIERRLAGTGVGEQMPWLRSSWWRIRDWAIQEITKAVAPPPKR